MKSMMTGAALIAVALAAQPAFAQSFTNPTPIAVVDGGETTSNIAVSGLSGTITGLTLSLNGLSHTYPDDLVFGVLDVNAGIGFVFMSGAGGSTDVVNANLLFSDAASQQLPESFVGGGIVSGTYLPSNYLEYEFTNYTNVTSFAGFNGLNPNGTWTLFVDDTTPTDTGTVLQGWTLNFTTNATGGGVPEPASWAMMIAGFGLTGAAMRRTKTKVAFAA